MPSLITNKRVPLLFSQGKVPAATAQSPQYLSGQQQALQNATQRLATKVNGLSMVGTASQLPPAGLAGRTFLATDTGVQYVDNGSVWLVVGGSFAIIAPNVPSPYNVAANDQIIGASATAGAAYVLNLPAPTGSGKWYTAIKTDSNPHPVTLSAVAFGGQIGSVTTKDINTQFDGVTVVDFATNLWLISWTTG